VKAYKPRPSLILHFSFFVLSIFNTHHHFFFNFSSSINAISVIFSFVTCLSGQ
jgi:hypothetical protein